MTIQELDIRKGELMTEVNKLVSLKKERYSNVDIESPMSSDEKMLNKQIADCYSEINAIVIEKRKFKTA